MESLFKWKSDNIRGGLTGDLANFGELDKIVVTALRSLAGSKGRSLSNLRRYFVRHDRVLFVVGEACLDVGSQILPKQINFRRSCQY